MPRGFLPRNGASWDVLFQEVSYSCSMEKSLTIDLHIHSTFSDGVLKPSELVDMAKTDGLSAISITDHDTATGKLI